MGDESVLQPDAIDRAVSTVEVFASFCRVAGIDDVVPVGTSAIRDAHNRDEVLDLIQERTGLEARVLSGAEEAYYGYLAVVNSTTLSDGFALDMGGGSIQLSRIEEPTPARRRVVAARRGPRERALPARRGGVQ